MEQLDRSDDPRTALRSCVLDYLGKMRALGLLPNRGVAFCQDPRCEGSPDAYAWLLVDPRTPGERWVLLDDGGVWHEAEGGPSVELPHSTPVYEWLDRPSLTLERLLGHSLFNARLGGSGFLSNEERFARRPYVIGDRRSNRGPHPGAERRRAA
jgi:hypothetical protein